MKRFEYKIISNQIGMEYELNRLGNDGWELVSVGGGGAVLYLKREI